MSGATGPITEFKGVGKTCSCAQIVTDYLISSIVKVAPLPGELFTSTLPCSFSSSFATILSPIPVGLPSLLSPSTLL